MVGLFPRTIICGLWLTSDPIQQWIGLIILAICAVVDFLTVAKKILPF